jgi:hypothetical protein
MQKVAAYSMHSKSLVIPDTYSKYFLTISSAKLVEKMVAKMIMNCE